MKHKRPFSGQSLLEFALILPLALFLLLGFFDLGRAVFYYASLSNAVREASRDGIVANLTTEADFEDYLTDQVEAYGFGLNMLDMIDIDANPVNIDTDEFIEVVEVTATYCFVPVTPGITSIISTTCTNGMNGFDLEAVSVMQMEPGKRFTE